MSTMSRDGGLAGRNPVRAFLLDLRVGAKIVVAVAVVAVIAAGVTAFALVRINRLDQTLTMVKTDNVDSLRYLDEARSGLEKMYTDLDGYLASLLYRLGSPADAAKAARTALAADDAKADSGIAGYAAIGANAAGSPDLARFQSTVKQYRGMRDVVLFGDQPPPGLNMPSDQAKLPAAFQAAQADMDASLDSLIKSENASASEAVANGHQANRSAVWTILAIMGVGLVFAAFVAFVITRSIVAPLRRVSAALASVAHGDLTNTVEVRSKDEVGEMASSLNDATASIRRTVSALVTSATTLTNSSSRLSQVSDKIAVSADGASARATEASDAAHLVSLNLQTVAAGAEEMGASIREISSSANDGARVAGEAVSVAGSAAETMSRLGDSSAEIGTVIKTITSIAEQTNLLALNATIEAARAGEAGKGFAVVAGEVKDLAQETAKATEDIARRVETIQADGRRAVESIDEITRIIARINDYQVTIASAVEEQTATTQEMNRNVNEAAKGSAGIAGSITGVAEAAQSTAESTSESRSAAEDLTRVSGELRDLVARFRY